MDQNLFEELNIDRKAGLAQVEEAFWTAVKERIRRIAEHYNEQDVQEEEKNLRLFYNMFFQYILAWVKEERARHKGTANHPEAAKHHQAAQKLLVPYHKLLMDYGSCYLHIGRYMTLLRDEIQKEEQRHYGAESAQLRWTSDAGIVIGRYKKNMQDILDMNDRMTKAQDVLGHMERDMDMLSDSAQALFGKEKATLFIRSLTVALRAADMEKAARLLDGVADEKKRFGAGAQNIEQHMKIIGEAGSRLCRMASENYDNLLNAEDRLFLRRSETASVYEAHNQELKKIKEFLGKYHMPYMRYKLDTLAQLKDKLLVVGSLDGLAALYSKLVMGLAKPLPDMAAVRAYENDVTGPAHYLVQSLHDEIPKIRQRADETVREFRDNTREFAAAEQIDIAAVSAQ